MNKELLNKTSPDKKKKIEEALERGVERIYPSRSALKEALLSGKKIRIYQGFDPSMPNLHLGNLVGILKLQQFQELGHKVIFLVGDFTGMIGDPTEKLSVRKKLTREQVLKNAESWKEQVARFLNFSGKNPAEMKFNSQWLDKISFKELIEAASNFTVQQMIQRDFFQKRIERKEPIFLHEFLYPIAQAIDSVKMDIDLEIGGSDQMFNMLAGRDLMRAEKGKQKFVLTTNMLVDKEGRKVGKTTGGAIFLNVPSSEMYGGIMAFSDDVIILGFELLTKISFKEIREFERILADKGENPIVLKKRLAFEVVKLNFGEKKANEAQEEFERVFGKRKLPKDIPEIKLKEKELNVLDLLAKTSLAFSKSEAKRLVEQGGVSISGRVEKNWKRTVKIKKGLIVRVGKRKFVKIE